MSDIVKELQDIREWFVHKNMNMMACTIDEAVTSIKYGEQQARILQSSWDACVNSRANLQSKITTIEQQLADLTPVCDCQCCREVDNLKLNPPSEVRK